MGDHSCDAQPAPRAVGRRARCSSTNGARMRSDVRIGARAGEDVELEQLGLHVLRGPRRAQAEQQAGALRRRRPGRRRTSRGSRAERCRTFSSRFSDSMMSMTASTIAQAIGPPPNVVPSVSDLQIGRDVIGDQHRRHREARAERLRRRDDVGRDAVHVRRERIAGAADAALHFVEDQDRAVLAAAEAQRLEKFLRHVDRAGDALHRLDDHRGGADRRSACRAGRRRVGLMNVDVERLAAESRYHFLLARPR